MICRYKIVNKFKAEDIADCATKSGFPAQVAWSTGGGRGNTISFRVKSEAQCSNIIGQCLHGVKLNSLKKRRKGKRK